MVSKNGWFCNQNSGSAGSGPGAEKEPPILGKTVQETGPKAFDGKVR
jgi:hypothetical protein